MTRRPLHDVRLPDHEDTIAPVTILDADGHVLRVVPAREFRPTPVIRTAPMLVRARRTRDSA
jgi:hypothetical protein